MDKVLDKVKEGNNKYLRNGIEQNVDAKYLWLQVVGQVIVGAFMFFFVLTAATGGENSGFYDLLMGSQVVMLLIVSTLPFIVYFYVIFRRQFKIYINIDVFITLYTVGIGLVFGGLFGIAIFYMMIAFEAIVISKVIKDFPIIAMNVDLRKGNEITYVDGKKLTKAQEVEIVDYKFKLFNMLPIPIIKF